MSASCSRYEQAPGCPTGRWGQSSRIYRSQDYCSARALDAVTAPLCAEAESEEWLGERGWIVLRNLASPDELDIIRQRANFTNLCHPVVTETEQGRRRCAYSSDEFRQALPLLWTSLHTLLHRWESSGLATRADLGHGLRLDPEHDRVARLIHVTTPTTTPDIRDRYFAGWHVDNHGSDGSHNFHWVWLMVEKDEDGVDEQTNICVASTSSVDAIDSPEAREQWTVGDAHRRMLDERACCPRMRPGDAVFYREDVAHRTQDDESNRLGMVINIDTLRPDIPTPEDVRCAEWAAGGRCSTSEFMKCACAKACREL